jgi:hypothetical protein
VHSAEYVGVISERVGVSPYRPMGETSVGVFRVSFPVIA